MRNYLFILALCVLPASAQTEDSINTTTPSNQTPAKSTTIDLKALNLLARVTNKYYLATSYRGVTEIRFGEEGQKMEFMRFRLELWRFRFGTVVRSDHNGITRLVTDGNGGFK